jgi:hypothetical protein
MIRFKSVFLDSFSSFPSNKHFNQYKHVPGKIEWVKRKFMKFVIITCVNTFIGLFEQNIQKIFPTSELCFSD